MACAFADVVEAENLVIDKALHQVEGAPAKQDPADQCLSACRPAPLVCSSPQNPKADYDDDPHEGVEESVCERVVLKPRNGRFRMPAHAAEHVVPLKDLVEKDSIHRPAETDAQQDSGDAWTCDSLGIPARSKVRTGSVCRVDRR